MWLYWLQVFNFSRHFSFNQVSNVDAVLLFYSDFADTVYFLNQRTQKGFVFDNYASMGIPYWNWNLIYYAVPEITSL